MNHIAYLVSEYPHVNLPSAGGIGSFVKTMASSLVQKKIQVTIFLAFAKENKIWHDDTIRIVTIKKVKPSKLASIFDRIYIGKIIREYVQKDNIDLLEAPDWEGIHAFCNLKIPIITRIHGSVTYFNHIQKTKNPKIINFFEKKALKQSNKIIAVSNFSGKLTKKLFNLKNSYIETIYNGVDLKKFTSSENNLSKEKNSILYFGSLVLKKGVLELAYIFNKLYNINKNARLIIVGKDTIDYIEKVSTWHLMQQILNKDTLKHVSYIGVVPYQEMKNIIKKSHLCVFPSFAEAFPISWLEAMALQKPIVASSIGWAKESIINKHSGLLEHPKNHTEFAKKINSLLKDNELSNTIGVNAKQRAIELFDQKKLVMKNIKTYQKLISNE